MAMLLFTGVNGLGVVFLVYVLLQFWKEGQRSKKLDTKDQLIKISQENRPTVVVVTRPISASLQIEPVSHSSHAGPSVISRQARMSGPRDRQFHRGSADATNEIPMNRFSTSLFMDDREKQSNAATFEDDWLDRR